MSNEEVHNTKLVHKLNGVTEKERTVLLGRELGRTFQDLGSEFGHSKQAAAYILERAKAKIAGTYIFRGRGKPRDEEPDSYTIHLTRREKKALMGNRVIKSLIKGQSQPTYLKRALLQIFDSLIESEVEKK